MDQIGRYRVLRELGHGGMGQVFLAKDPTLERRVAIKMLRTNPVRSSLRDEAKALAALSHPNIVTVFEIGEHEGHEFIAMEYVPGTTLRHKLDAGAPRAELLAICAKVVDALAAAHQAGILHRDIKPENILVGERGDVKVVDFGIAWRVDSAQQRLGRAPTAREVLEPLATLPGIGAAPTLVAQVGATVTAFTASTHTLFGTPAYMAPELLHGDAPTEASDVYSIGILLYECVKGERPHQARTLAELIAQIIEKPVARPADPLGELIERLLAHDPEVRPSLAEVGAALRPKVPTRRLPYVLALALAIAVSAVVAMLWLMHSEPSPPKVWVAPIEVVDQVPPGAPGGPWVHPANPEEQLAEMFLELGVQLEQDRDDATHALHIQVVHHTGGLRAKVTLVELGSGAIVEPRLMEHGSHHLWSLLSAIALQSSHELVGSASRKTEFARQLYARGKRLLDDSEYHEAAIYLEQAVEADRELGDAWYALALARAWIEEPLERIEEAAMRAVNHTRDPERIQLMRGAQLMLTGKFAESRAVLEPLVSPEDAFAERERLKVPRAENATSREVLYFLGEANWHDGRYSQGFRYFKRILDRERFRPATIHAMQYALARRDPVDGPMMTGLLGENPDLALFSLGEYARLADDRSTNARMRLHAFEVLERSIPDDALAGIEGPLDADVHRVAWALAAADLDSARPRFTRIWDTLRKDPNPNVQHALEALAEVVIVAGRTDEAREISAFMAEHSKTGRPMRGFPRLAILAAGLVRDRALIPPTTTERDHTLARAITAELDGDLSTAAKLLDELVRDPSFTWDYPERAALLRVLRARGEHERAAALCEDSMRPAIYRFAFSVLRRLCRTR